MKLLKTLLLMAPLALSGCSLFPEHMHPGHVFTDNTKLTWGFKDSECNYNLETKLYDLEVYFFIRNDSNSNKKINIPTQKGVYKEGGTENYLVTVYKNAAFTLKPEEEKQFTYVCEIPTSIKEEDYYFRFKLNDRDVYYHMHN